MIQEIITYIIIGFAVVLAFYKSYKKLARKNRSKSPNGKGNSPAIHTGCANCTADCILRNASPDVKNENAQLCEQNLKQLKCS